MKHLLKLETLPRADFETILRDTAVFKRERGQHPAQPLAGQTWALMFSKQSTRTRLSFEVGIRELGGHADVFERGGHPAWPRRADQGHRARHGPDGSRRGHPHLCAARRGAVCGIFQDPDHQRADGRRTSVPDSRGHFHVSGKARLHRGQDRCVHRRRRVQRGELVDLGGGKTWF